MSTDPAWMAARALEAAWARGEVPDVEDFWHRYAPDGAITVLCALIKADLHGRSRRGERLDVARYLDGFPALREARERVVSLVYEEYCLREERGEAPDPDSFCDRYAEWRDSLVSQLRYHRLLSQVVSLPSSPPRYPRLGDRFSTFRLRSILGEGGSARVFLAVDESLGDRPVALKVSSDRGEEPKIQGRLNHPHIVPVHAVILDEETGLRGLCMPYRAGLPLDEVIRRIDPPARARGASALREVIPPVEDAGAADPSDLSGWVGFPSDGTYAEGAAWVGSVIARALSYAHGRGVLHRDVKPANVLLTSSDGPQLLDFNLAHSPHDAGQAEEALRGGTLPYMAPEQLEAFLDPGRWEGVGPAADTYSVGLLLDEMLTGRRPPPPAPSSPLPRAIREMLDLRMAPRTPARRSNPRVPHALDAILDRCLAPDPGDRYPSARDLAEDLRRFVEHRPLALADNPSFRERASNRLQAHRAAVVAVLAGMALVAAFFALLAWYGGDGLDDPKDLVTLGTSLDRQGKPDAAREKYRRALRIDPNCFLASWGLAKLDHDAGDEPAALRNFRQATRQVERQGLRGKAVAAMLHSHGALLYKRGLSDDAATLYEKAIGAYDGASMHPTHYGLASIAWMRGKFPAALEQVHQAIAQAEEPDGDGEKVDPEKIALYRALHAKILSNLGTGTLADLGTKRYADDPKGHDLATSRFREAERDIAQARAVGKGFTTAEANDLTITEGHVLIGLGDLHSRLDEYRESLDYYDRARQSLDRVLASDPRNPAAGPLRNEVSERLKTDRAQLAKRAGRDGIAAKRDDP